MTMQDLRNLISFAAQAASKAPDPVQQARYEGMAEAFSFVIAQRLETDKQALYWAIESQHRPGTPAFIEAYDRAACKQELPPLAVQTLA